MDTILPIILFYIFYENFNISAYYKCHVCAVDIFFGEQFRNCDVPSTRVPLVWQNRIRLSMVFGTDPIRQMKRAPMKRGMEEEDHLALWVPYVSTTVAGNDTVWCASCIVLAYLSSRMRYNSEGLRYCEYDCEIREISQWFRSPLCPFY